MDHGDPLKSDVLSYYQLNLKSLAVDDSISMRNIDSSMEKETVLKWEGMGGGLLEVQSLSTLMQ